MTHTKITTQWGKDGNHDHGIPGMAEVLDLDATLANLGRRLTLTAKEKKLLTQIADGELEAIDLPPALREKLKGIKSREALEALLAYDIAPVTTTATALIEDKIGGDARLAEMIATHPQAEFMWGKDPLQTLTAMSLRQQLAIVTKYWGGYHKMGNEIIATAIKNNDPEAIADGKSFSLLWQNFQYRLQSKPPNIERIMAICRDKSPSLNLNYSIQEQINLLLKHPQLSRSELDSLSGYQTTELLFEIYAFSHRHKTPHRKHSTLLTDVLRCKTLSPRTNNRIITLFETVRYRLDGKRSWPELAQAVAGYVERNNIKIPDAMNQSTDLQTLADILLGINLGGKALVSQMHIASIPMRPRKGLQDALDGARRGEKPYWSDDWECVIQYMNSAAARPVQQPESGITL